MQSEAIEGQVLAGKYRIERVLGRGGMGVVVAAHHIQLDEKVAIKFLLPEAVTSPEVVGRFVREARAAVRIKSEHVARVSDVGTLDSGAPYMVMEYLEGSDLAGWLERDGALPIEQAVEFVLQASEAISEAHALGIVHRDLKPANLFVVRRADGLWSIKVLDFGISKLSRLSASGTDINLTQTNAIMGSPLYMPPEQMAASKSVDARADIWSLGVILYELMSGKAPFAGQTLPEVCIKIAIEPPQPIRELRADVPPALEAVILCCLEKDRERRYPSLAELAHALIDFAPERARGSVERITRTIGAAGLATRELRAPLSSGKTAASSAPPATPVLSAGGGTEAPWGRTARSGGAGKRKRAAVTIFALLILGSIGIGIILGAARLWRSSPAGAASAASAAQPAPLSTAKATAQPDVPAVTPAPSEATGHVANVAPEPQAADSSEPKTSPQTPPQTAAQRLPPGKRAAPSAPTAPRAAAVPVAPRPQQKGDIFDDR